MWTIRGTTNRLALLGIVVAGVARGVITWRTHGERSVDECLGDGGAVLVLDGRQVCNVSSHNVFDVTPIRPVWASVGIALSTAVMLGAVAVLLVARVPADDGT